VLNVGIREQLLTSSTALEGGDSRRDQRSRCRFAVYRPGIPDASPRSHGMPCRGSMPDGASARLAVFAPDDPGHPRRVLSLGEAKWDKAMNLGHLARLRRARDLLAVKGYDTSATRLTCYSGAGFDRELSEVAAADPVVQLIGLDQLYDCRQVRVRSGSWGVTSAGGLFLAEVPRLWGATHCDLRVAVM
jgi:hypothetical protein